jgi:hypothetical protein
MSRSVWAAVSPKHLKLVLHWYVAYDPCMPIVKVNVITFNLPSRKKPHAPVPQWVAPLSCICQVEGEGTPVVWPSELQDEQALFVPTIRPGVRPLQSECCVSFDWLTLTFQMSVVHLIPGPLSFSHLILWLCQTQ